MTRGFDIAVVGAGSAGCLVARRLASDGSRRVLLVEAGPDPGSVGPALRDGWGLPRGAAWPFDWGYTTEPDAAGETTPLRRGRIVGGTSWLTRFAVRGSPADFDGWAANGLDGWSFDDVLPAFRRIERDLEYGDSSSHGRDGPLTITRYPQLPRHPVHAAAVDAMVAAGLAAVADMNAPDALGVGPMPMSSVDGRRISAADAFLPAGDRPPNLTVRPETHVARVIVTGGRATGIRLVDGSELSADGTILCCGTYGSPALLLRSGIGPADELRRLGIAVSLDLPGVGQNLADHSGVELPLGAFGARPGAPILHSIGSWHSSLAGAGDSPDMLFWLGDPQGEAGESSIEAVLMRPAARGTVRLRSADPAAAPIVTLPDARTPADLERLGEGHQRAVEIASSPELRAVLARAGDPADAPAVPENLPAWIAENAYHVPHVVGTCAMGVSPADGAVVDGQGRVHGIAGLRVVDASILPEPPSGFPNLVTMMVAEHIASKALETGSI